MRKLPRTQDELTLHCVHKVRQSLRIILISLQRLDDYAC